MGDRQIYGLGLGSRGNAHCSLSPPRVSGTLIPIVVFGAPPPIATLIAIPMEEESCHCNIACASGWPLVKCSCGKHLGSLRGVTKMHARFVSQKTLDTYLHRACMTNALQVAEVGCSHKRQD